MSEGVKVKGLAELRRELKKLENASQFEAQLKDVNFAVASKVVGDSKARTSTRLLGKAMESLTASKSGVKAQVAIGGGRYEFALGAIFGGRGRPTTQQFQPYLGHTGYAVMPAIRDGIPAIIEMYGDALEKITSAAFPD